MSTPDNTLDRQLAEMVSCISQAKLDAYASLLPGQNENMKVRLFFTMSQLSSYFFLPLQILELALRNKINDSLIALYSTRKKRMVTHKYGSGNPHEWYLWMPQDLRTCKRIQRSLKHANDAISLSGRSASSLTIGDVISQISLGLWIKILDEWAMPGSDLHFWDRIVNHVFPFRGKVKRCEILDRLDKINRVRNRLFHHEPIWKDPGQPFVSLSDAFDSLENKFSEINMVIGWMTLNIEQRINALDKNVFKRQVSHYRNEFLNI